MNYYWIKYKSGDQIFTDVFAVNWNYNSLGDIELFRTGNHRHFIITEKNLIAYYKIEEPDWR